MLKFSATPLQDAYLIELERRGDQRGYFARMFCEKEFAARGLVDRFVQVNKSSSAKKGTLRGMHYQLAPAAEAKVVGCWRGALWDCIVDLRSDSPSFGRWFGTVLDDRDGSMLYIPRGFAHGLLTLTDDVEALYLMSDFYAPEVERGLRYDDPWLAIEWPGEIVEISPKDRAWPLFDPEYHGIDRLRGLK